MWGFPDSMIIWLVPENPGGPVQLYCAPFQLNIKVMVSHKISNEDQQSFGLPSRRILLLSNKKE